MFMKLFVSFILVISAVGASAATPETEAKLIEFCKAAVTKFAANDMALSYLVDHADELCNEKPSPLIAKGVGAMLATVSAEDMAKLIESEKTQHGVALNSIRAEIKKAQAEIEKTPEQVNSGAVPFTPEDAIQLCKKTVISLKNFNEVFNNVSEHANELCEGNHKIAFRIVMELNNMNPGDALEREKQSPGAMLELLKNVTEVAKPVEKMSSDADAAIQLGQISQDCYDRYEDKSFAMPFCAMLANRGLDPNVK
jgi:hypothetical protein